MFWTVNSVGLMEKVPPDFPGPVWILNNGIMERIK